MAKRKLTQSAYENRVKQGHGTPDSETYCPWYSPHEETRRTVLRTLWNGKMLTFYARRQIFYGYDRLWFWKEEQTQELFTEVIVPRKDGCAIAEALNAPGISYPDSDPIRTDFYISTRSGDRAVLLMNEEAIRNSPPLQSDYEIRRLFYEKEQVPFFLVSPDALNPIRSKNIQFLLAPNPLDQQSCSADAVYFFAEEFRKGMRSPVEIARDCETRFHLCAGDGNHIFRLLAVQEQIDINLNQPIDYCLPAYLLSRNASSEIPKYELPARPLEELLSGGDRA